MNDPKRHVVVAMLGTAIVATMVGPIAPPKYVALLFVYILLALLAEVAPSVAVPLAWLVFIVILFSGAEAFKVFARKGEK